ncbi:hypothetical protein C2U70_02295 [Bradyrhizobium guangdongense]|uniref:STM3941 family protein n=1 Tax=Bradyrhizobium guangdongense TaxID=1325090 RepID=UPI0011279EF6|nr:STM3941 family protein [Bradyrhizobium guangdongense]TPQ41825.1 hypothetical protein C2U70_02295 [Bradyrhizobium guangdongense]
MAVDKVNDILARFPGPVTLRVSLLKMLALFLGSLGFVLIGVLLIVFVKDDPEARIAGLASVVFFGACAVIGAVMLLPGAGSLTLEAKGFEVRSLFRRNHVAWPQASRFAVVTLQLPNGGSNRMVGYDDDKLKGLGADFSRDKIGRSAALPDSYGLSLEELTRLLTEWRERALAQRAQSSVPRVPRP